MSNPSDHDATPIASVDQMAAHLAAGCKPREDWRIGTEHEKFGFVRPEAARSRGLAPYAAPPFGPDGIESLLAGLAGNGQGWEPIRDEGQLIGLKGSGRWKGASVSLEPAGQFELSGAPLRSLHDTRTELDAHLAELRTLAEPLGIGFAPLGFQPLHGRDAMPVMPKSRYAIMRRYMPRVGSMGLDMMLRTCTVQVNLDYGSEADMARKLRVSLALQPVATALFASSPFRDGRPSGFLSTRAHVWTDTDNQRSGMPPFFFEEGFGFGRYVEWVLDVPMYFVSRDDRLVDAAGLSFRRWMAGEEPALARWRPTLGDFDDHLTTAFTDVRVKRFLEMRGADAGTPQMMVAQSAFWVGLLYDEAALLAAERLVRELPWDAYPALRAAVPTQGLRAAAGSRTARDLARDALAIASDGLRARALRDGEGADERRFLAPLEAIVAGAPNQAEHWLARFDGPWNRDVRPIFDEAAV
ncbi:glutamate--cysteine ligase [Rhizosaccharibacter radicis]|uniref:Glutamate--cysteine ligase n=1 Tax=Rhizosaccharibacter radicis TaxID=2782605 RepID=A0ABT1VVT0_9PROT|nr:glutamate--cysteine ligase [Acetobacteraceae bacterium KSS12]